MTSSTNLPSFSADKDPTDKDPTDQDPADKDPTDKDPTDKDPSGQVPTDQEHPTPVLLPLGDKTVLLRFGDRLNEQTNIRAINAAFTLRSANLSGVEEVTPNLISVALRYDPAKTGFMELCGNIRLALQSATRKGHQKPKHHMITMVYGGEAGPDLETAAMHCKLTAKDFIKAHTRAKLRVLATGFAPGFVYCGLHQAQWHIPRRKKLHASVAPGSVLFAAGQTAIAATPLPTGWHVIGRTDFCNFLPDRKPPTLLNAGDMVQFSNDGTL